MGDQSPLHKAGPSSLLLYSSRTYPLPHQDVCHTLPLLSEGEQRSWPLVNIFPSTEAPWEFEFNGC